MDSSGSPGTGFVVFLVLVILDAILFSFHAALKVMNETELENRSSQGDKKAKWLHSMKLESEKTKAVMYFANILVSMVVGSMMVRFLGNIWNHYLMKTVLGGFFAHQLIWGFAYFTVALLLVMVLYTFGVHLPQKVGSCFPEKVANSLSGIARLMIGICYPFTYVTGKLVCLIVRLFGVDLKKAQEDVTEAEIMSMVNEGHEQGVLEASEAEMIHNIFELGDKEAQDIMTHRKNIVALNSKMNLRETIDILLESANSRFPVYEENIDNIIGILYLKDAMRVYNKGIYGDWLIGDIPELVRPAVYIPETRNINQLFQTMQSQKIQMVIVVDEYGQTAGLIALEDILEEIVGNILDEYDEDEAFIEKNPDGSYIMKGMTPLDEIEDLLEIQLQEEEYETLNGFLVYRLGHIPQEEEDTIIEEKGFSFCILQVSNKVIDKVLVQRLSKKETIEE